MGNRKSLGKWRGPIHKSTSLAATGLSSMAQSHNQVIGEKMVRVGRIGARNSIDTRDIGAGGIRVGDFGVSNISADGVGAREIASRDISFGAVGVRYAGIHREDLGVLKILVSSRKK